MIGGSAPEPADDPNPKRVELWTNGFMAQLPGAMEVFPGFVLFAWPPVGLVLLLVGLEGPPLVLSESAELDLPRLPELLTELEMAGSPPPTPDWLAELFGDVEPSSTVAEAFAAYLDNPNHETSLTLRAEFERSGWELHARMLY